MESASEYGKRLVAARENMGVTLEEVSYELKINLNTLKNLEASDSKNLPKPGFTKGFIKAYCKFLNISPALILEEYEQTVGSLKPDMSGSVLIENSESKNFFILDFLKDQFLPLVLFSSVVGAAFTLYTLLGSYEDSHSIVADSVKIEKMVDVTPVAENSDLEASSETLEEAPVELAFKETVELKQPTPAKVDTDASVPVELNDEASVEASKIVEEVKVIEEKPKYVPPTGKHKLIIEPLADTYLYIQTSTDRRPVKATLVPDKIRTFRFDKAEIRFMDAGAVNVIFDGDELGALGVFGEEKKLEFPSLKEI